MSLINGLNKQFHQWNQDKEKKLRIGERTNEFIFNANNTIHNKVISLKKIKLENDY